MYSTFFLKRALSFSAKFRLVECIRSLSIQVSRTFLSLGSKTIPADRSLVREGRKRTILIAMEICVNF